MEAKRMAGFGGQRARRLGSRFAGVLDSATNGARVGVNTDLAYRRDRSLRADVAVDNTVGLLGLGLGGSLALQELPLTNVAALRDGSNPDRLVTQTGYAFLPRTPETFLYDADGNLLRDGRWIYTWDAENRLVRVQSRPDTPPASWRRVEWQYDALGRRIRQTTSVWTNGTWQVTEDLKLISDPVLFGRHIVELNATNNALVRTYVWGLDLSGSLVGAGGVGGLLWLTVHSGPAAGTHYCCYDGNGNVVGLISATTGTETARYEYGPFAEPIRVNGPAARSNPFRFSTKRVDDTTDLVLYEYRAYSPVVGRWPNRDPIGELGFHLLRTGQQMFLSSNGDAPPTPGGVRDAAFGLIQELGLVDADAVNEFLGRPGGLNLYCLTGNDPLNFTDYLGLAPFCVCIRADDDHAWIWVKDLATGEVHTYGRWKKGYGRPAANKSGVIVDMEKNRGYGASRCIQVQEFKPTINEGYDLYNNNCATYAWSEWKRVSGENLKKSSLFGIRHV